MIRFIESIVWATCGLSLFVAGWVVKTMIEREYLHWAGAFARSMTALACCIRARYRREWSTELETIQSEGDSGLSYAVECLLGAARIRSRDLVRTLAFRNRTSGAIDAKGTDSYIPGSLFFLSQLSHYAGSRQATRWIAASEDPAMIYANLSAAASSAVETILQKGRLSRAPMDYVSIGPGDVSFDSSFLSRLSRRAVVETYVSVDISSEILSSRVQRVCSELGENAMKVLAVLTDVSELVGVDTFLRDAPRRALYSLNLGTPGAIDEQTLIGELYSTMAPDDSLLVRCQLHPYGAEHLADLPEGDCDRLLAPFSSSAFATFAKGPIEDAFAPEFLNGQLMLRPRHGISQVNNAIDIEAFYVTNDSDSDGGYHVTTTRLYDHFSIARWFRRSGWRIRWSEHLSDAGTGLYLLKKKW